MCAGAQMIALHSVYVVTLVSQATSAGILCVLACFDRRIRGMSALAAACILHAVAIALMPFWRGGNVWEAAALSATLLPLIFWLTLHGLWPFLRARPLPRSRGLPALSAVIVVVVTLAPRQPLVSMQISRIAAMVLMALTVRVLWQPEMPSVRLPARIAAALLTVVLLSYIGRLPFELHNPNSPMMITLREITMVSITLLAFSFLVLYLAESKRRLHQETRMDALTGLLNRRALEERAATAVRRAGREGKPLALLMMDLDAFKLLNDTWGHNVGDRALRAVGDVLLQEADRSASTVARLGGEEFAMLAPGQDLAAGHALAEQVRAAVAAIVILEGQRRVTLTISVGLSKWHTGESTWTEMLRRADAALYRAKREGRNRVVCSDPSESCPQHTHPAPSSPFRRAEPAQAPSGMQAATRDATMDTPHKR